MDITQLKAQAYDIISQIEFLQTKLREVNQLIADEINKPPMEEKPENNGK